MATLISALGLVAYYNSLETPFVFDDRSILVDNPHLHRLWPPAWFFTTNRGVADFTFALNHALGGLNVRGYHVTNLAIHVLAALVLFGLVKRTLSGERLNERFGQHATGLALCVALVWMLHPLQTQSVTYTVQRYESLTGLFYLLTLYCFRRAVDSPHKLKWYAASVLACVLGLRVKELMITAPVIVLCYDRVFVSTSWRDVWNRKYYYLALVAAGGLLLGPLLGRVLRGLMPQLWPVDSQAVVEIPSSSLIVVEGLTPLSYLASQPAVILHYLRLSILPIGQCLDYDWPVVRSLGAILPAGSAIVALLLATVWAVFRHPAWGFLGVWFFVILAPTSSIVPIQDLAFEHRMYLPLAAVVVAVVLGGYLMLQRMAGNESARRVQFGIAVIVIALLGGLTIARNYVYRSNAAMWSDVVAKRPLNPRAQTNLGLALAEQNELEPALAAYREALRLRPNYSYAHFNLGNAYVEGKQWSSAEASYRRAIQFRPQYAEAHNNLGFVLSHQGEATESVACFEQALKLKPDYAGAHVNLALANDKQGKLDESAAGYGKALELDPTSAEAHNGLALVLAKQGHLERAIVHWEEALAIRPDYAAAHQHLGQALAAAGAWDDALVHCRRAVELAPDSLDAVRLLADTLRRTNRSSEARESYQRALQINPDDARSHAGLAALLARQGAVQEAVPRYRHALKLRPEDGEAHHGLANLLAQTGELEEADAHYRQALKLLPRDPLVRVNLALFCERRGNAKAAMPLYLEAIQLRPDFATAHLHLGSCLAGQQRFAEAIQHFQLAISHDPTLAEAHNNLANTLARVGRLQLAVGHYREALRLKPDFVQAQQNLRQVLQALQSARGTPGSSG